MQNNNCLAGMACPECGSLEPFSITCSAQFHVWDDGTEHYDGCDWNVDSNCICMRCNYAKTVKEFMTVDHNLTEKTEKENA